MAKARLHFQGSVLPAGSIHPYLWSVRTLTEKHLTEIVKDTHRKRAGHKNLHKVFGVV